VGPDDARFASHPQAFFSDMKDVDRDNEVNRILWAFKLNAYEKLNLRFDATPDDIKRQFRKLSLMVHPDKCKHPQAATAFDSEHRDGSCARCSVARSRRRHVLAARARVCLLLSRPLISLALAARLCAPFDKPW
jgi:hypothetical protein